MKPGAPPRPAATGCHQGSVVALRGGAYLLRPLCSEDEFRLQDFFSSHSQETIQARYGYMISTMSHERAAQLVNVDQLKDIALGIFETKEAGQVLHAVGRYYTEADPQSAEIAFVVREQNRRSGMAGVLLHELAATAYKHDLRFFHAQVRRDNQAMRHLLDRYHPQVSRMAGSDWMMYLLSINVILRSRVKVLAGDTPTIQFVGKTRAGN
jgi:RimJ/RimL family protein N-acetyltransferase